MTEKTLPEQARFLAKFVEEREYDEWPWADYEIAQMLEDLAAEIERLQSELGIANKDFAEMSRTYVEVRNERDRAKYERDELRSWLKDIRQNATFENDITQAQAVYKLAVIETLAEELLCGVEGQADEQ